MGAMGSQIISNATVIELLNYLLWLTSAKHQSSALLALCEGNSPVTGEFPTQTVSNAEKAFIWWRHHEMVQVKSECFLYLTHWGRVTHICVSELTIIGSDNGLSPGRHQAIIWTNAGILLIGPLRTSFSEIFIEIHTFSFKEMRLKMSSGKWRPHCLGLNVFKNTVISTTADATGTETCLS